MSHVRLSARALADLARLHQFLVVKDKDATKRAVLAIREAFLPLARFSLIGRPVDESHDLRELVIDFGASAYLALYRFEIGLDVVTVLAIKHQQEEDYK